MELTANALKKILLLYIIIDVIGKKFKQTLVSIHWLVPSLLVQVSEQFNGISLLTKYLNILKNLQLQLQNLHLVMSKPDSFLNYRICKINVDMQF